MAGEDIVVRIVTGDNVANRGRYVYKRLTIDGEDYAVALTIYIHQDDVRESDVRERIRERCSSYGATLNARRALEQTTTDAE
ncbi:MAG: hypothetical protein K0S78_4108 [Thermomicrobiales bacterium]|nr:hypothetical protein [Thermomicrobiales bacterium]MDF3041918.1 hypothetical protein [Thermomicrobiales bacterium]